MGAALISDLIQYLSSGLTVGSVYALIALGFTLIYNSTQIANFAQGDFAMIGAMTTVFSAASGVPIITAAVLAPSRRLWRGCSCTCSPSGRHVTARSWV